MGLHGVAMKQDLAAAAQRHPGRRADHRKGRIFQRPVGLLALRRRDFDLGPGGDICGEKRQTQIGADREIVALVVDDQRLEILAPPDESSACRAAP